MILLSLSLKTSKSAMSVGKEFQSTAVKVESGTLHDW